MASACGGLFPRPFTRALPSTPRWLLSPGSPGPPQCANPKYATVSGYIIVHFQVYVKINKDAEADEAVHESAKLYFNRMEQGLQDTRA